MPGWQYSAAAFASLQGCLNSSNDHVLDYHGESDRQHWLKDQARRIPENTVLIGWSLGGMLAYELASMTKKVSRVLVINANVKFAGGPGLEVSMAEDFLNRYTNNPSITRRRFAALTDSKHPKAAIQDLLEGNHLATLKWLYQIDLRSQELDCPVHVLLAEQDQLVPEVSARAAWLKQATTVTTIPGEHSTPWSAPDTLSAWVNQYG